MNDADVFETSAEPIGADLRHHRLDPLTDRCGAGDHLYPPVAAERDAHVEPRKNRGGDFIFDVIGGSKLKVLIDDTGRRPAASPGLSADHPRPPFGAAAGRLAREHRGRGYRRRVHRPGADPLPARSAADHRYGFSPVEQMIVTINTGIRRGLMPAVVLF